jgi:CubicO group peptidase (beta-lactamase class C family)
MTIREFRITAPAVPDRTTPSRLRSTRSMPLLRVSAAIFTLASIVAANLPQVLADEPSAAPSDGLATKVDELFAPWNRPDAPGGAVGIMHEGKLVYAKGFGAANLDDETPNTPQTVFEIASASKSFTCVCVAMLLDKGKLHLDDELGQFLPEMHKFEPPIRIRHMIQCRTGLWEPYHIMPLAGWENLPVQNAFSQADLLTVLAGQKKLPFERGAEFHYGSGDYYLLGLIVERVTGKSLAEFARENVFQPLGMSRTFFEEDPTLVVKGRAVGHYREGGVWRQWRVNACLPGACGVKTCVEDLARWDQNFDHNRLPSGKYVDEFFREGTLLGNRHVLDADAYRKYVQQPVQNPPAGQYRGLKRMQFTGGVWGMTAAISRFPDQRFTVVCLSNSDDLSPFAKTREIADVYLADLLAPMPDAVSAEEPKESIELPLSELESKAGDYRLRSERRVWKVAVQDGDLHVIDPLQKAWRLKPLGDTRFRPAADAPFYKSARFHFHRDAPGQRYSMTLESHEHGFHEVLEFDPIELAELSLEKLQEYAGHYFSDELSTTYRFEVRGQSLWLRVGGRRWERLDPTVRDEFIPHVRTLHDNRVLTFRRNDGGRVTGLTAAFWRVPGVDFRKQAAPCGAVLHFSSSAQSVPA